MHRQPAPECFDIGANSTAFIVGLSFLELHFGSEQVGLEERYSFSA